MCVCVCVCKSVRVYVFLCARVYSQKYKRKPDLNKHSVVISFSLPRKLSVK